MVSGVSGEASAEVGSLRLAISTSWWRLVAGFAATRSAARAIAAILAVSLPLILAQPAYALDANPDAIRGELNAGRFGDAERHARELLLATERLHGPDSRQAAEVLDLLAESLRRGGRTSIPEALSACLRSLALKERLLPPHDPSLAISLENLGALHLANGNLAEARTALERALEIRTRAFGPWHADVARSLSFLANLEFTSARDDTARALVLRAIAIQDSVLVAEDPARAQLLDMLAGIHYECGEFREAASVYERVLSLRARTLGLDHPSTASTLHNLGTVFAEMGDYEEARQYLEQARGVMRHALRSGHPMIARTIAALAMVREKVGDLVGARTLYDEAVKIQRKAYGTNHADIAWNLMHVGRVDLALGRRQVARRALLEALRIQERVLPPDHTDLAWTLAALSRSDAESGAVDLALERCGRALAIQEKGLGGAHPDIAPTLALLARFHAMRGDTAGALDLALRSSRLRTEHLRLTSGGLSERQALAYAATGPTGLDAALALIATPSGRATPASVRQTWDAVVQTRTLVLDEMAARHGAALGDMKSEGTVVAAIALQEARQRVANLLVRGPGGDPPERYQALVRRARLEMERAERDLGARSSAFRSEHGARRGLQDVFNAVPSGWGLVAYASFDSESNRHYAAFVRGAAGEPVAVPIGDADRVDGLVRRWAMDVLSNHSERGPAAASAEAASRRSGRTLRAAIWDPIQKVLGDVAGVLIIPDGALYGVNFGALPGAGKTYLVEDSLLFHYVTSELDIVDKQSMGHRGSGLLAFGGVEFGAKPEHREGTRTGGGKDSAIAIADDCVGFYDTEFYPLPETRLEVEEIAQSWTDSTQAVVITGREATEATFKRLAPGKRILHLATHGFFLDPEECRREEVSTRGIGGLETSVRSRRRPSFYQQSPLLLSGVALAGANRRAVATPQEEDGILMAEEVASLDLRGVEWAVLSACDTGVAGKSRGEGILGLRRAFQTAGVSTLVISLWPVQDQAARAWMRALYQAKLYAAASTAQAVRTAMLEVLRSRRAQGRSTNPFFWASFLAAGDWN